MRIAEDRRLKIFLAVLMFATVARCADLPTLFLAGGEYSSSTSPHYSGFAAIASPVSTSLGAYVYGLYQGLIVKGKLTTSTTAGGADDLKTYCWKQGCLALVVVGTAGVSASSTAGLALADGGGFTWRTNSGWVAGLMAIQNTAAGVSKPSVLAGFGRTW